MQEGQKPRPLQENATTSSWPQTGQRTRAKPFARIPPSFAPLGMSYGGQAVEITLELLPHVGRQPLAAAPQRRNLQKGLQVLLDHLVELRLLRSPAPVGLDLHDPHSANGVPSGFRGANAVGADLALLYVT